MIKRIKTLIIIFIILFSIPTFVSAHDAAGGNTHNYGSCTWDWCYSGAGLRFSLYTYKGSGKPIYYGSYDYVVSNYTGINGRTAHIAVNSAGKVAYQVGEYSVNWSSGYYSLSMENGGFSGYIGSGASDFTSVLKGQIKTKFGLNNSNPDSETVKNKINNFFHTGLGLSDLPYAYITVEPTIYIYNKSSASYYGTLYELLNMTSPNTIGATIMNGINQPLYLDFPKSIFADQPTQTDTNRFVGYGSSYLVKIPTLSSLNGKSGVESTVNNSYRVQNRNNIINNGFGIGVFWIGDYVAATCKSTCGSNNLKCAEKFCEKDTSYPSKKACILDCNITEPPNLSCGSSTCTSNGASTSCDGSYNINSKASSCSADRYIKTECTQKINKLEYSKDLPNVFDPGVGGFNYNAYLDVYKECKITFNADAYTFDYASIKRGSRGSGNSTFNALSNAWNRYNGLPTTSSDPVYKYETSSTDKIKLTVDGKSYDLELKSSSLPDAALKTSGSKTIHRYDSGSDSPITFAGEKKYVSSPGSIAYELPKQCYSIKTALIYRPALGSNCTDASDLLSYGYYNTKKTSGKTNVVVTANLNKGCLSNNHTCYFTIGDESKDPTCYINSKHISGNTYELTFTLENPGGLAVTYEFDGITYYTNKYETQMEFKGISSDEDVSGKISYEIGGETVTKQCPVKLYVSPPSKPYNCVTDPNGGNNGQYAKYEQIQAFCAAHWNEDVNNYTSEKDCADKCGNPVGGDTCKKFTCTNEVDIKAWCSNTTKYTKAGYKSKEECINDCSCKDVEVKEYIYRPISLGKSFDDDFYAFPNRKAGSNWIGYEDKYTTDTTVFDGNPIYVIELDGDKIKTIKEDTASKGKGVYLYNKDDSVNNTNGTYKSTFIDSNHNIFTCVKGSGSGC